MNPFFICLTALALSSCANIQSQPTKAEAQTWVALSCSGIKTWHDCKQEALTVCPMGFYTADALENILIQRREVSIICKS